jgi:hypothetical protein
MVIKANQTEVKFEKEPKSAEQKKADNLGIPVYMETLELSDTQKDKLVKEIIGELEIIRGEREEIRLDKRCQALDNQYDGKVTEDEMQQFNLNRNVTKVKVDAVVTAAKQAFFEVDPIFAITPRPEFGKDSGVDVCNKQQDFLDQKLDNLPFEPEMDLVFHSSVVKGTGWLELFYDIKREQRRREERYETKLVPLLDPVTKKPVIVNGMPAMENQGLKDFLSNWPNAQKDYPGYVKKLLEGGDIEFVANYKETVYNDPRPKFHDIKDVYVRVKTDGFDGLKTTRLIAIRENYTYWELKREESDNKFYDIDKLIEDKNNPDKKVKNYETLDFDVWKCTYYFKLEESDTEETKVVIWFVEDKKVVIGSILYPYYAVQCCLIPFYIKRKKKGIYQPGLAEDLTDSNLAENAILNLTLGAAWINNTVTPITDQSRVHAQFLEKRFYHGTPIDAKAGSVDFLQKYMRPADIGGLINLMQYLVMGDEQVSRVSSGMSGAESPMDPSAPARKTLALLAESGKGVMDYIKHLIPSFNEIGYILLAMYYQMSKQGRAYTTSKGGESPFAVIERNDMVARTNIMARAYAFEIDKVNEKVLDLALYQTIRQEPLISKNPDAVYTLLKNIVEGWSKKWKNISNKVIPSLEEFKKAEIEATLRGVMMFMQAVMKNAQVTGVEPEFPVDKLMAMVTDLRAQLVTPPDPEVVKAQQKAQGANA